MSRSFRTLLVLVVASATACYHYVPVPDPEPVIEEGTSVRVHLAQPRSFDVSGYTAHDIRQVDGTWVGRSDGAWVVAARAMHAMGGQRFDPGSWILHVPESAVATTEVRRASWWRTVVSVAAVAAGVFVASEALQGTSADGGGGGDDPGRAVVPGG